VSAQTVNRTFLGTGSGLARDQVFRKWTGPIAAAVNIPQGSVAGKLNTDDNASPVIRPFVGNGTMTALGFAYAGYNNTDGAEGDGFPIDILSTTGRMVDYNAGGADAFAQDDGVIPAYGVDNQTCSKLSTDGDLIGMFCGLDDVTGEPIILVDPFIKAILALIDGISAPLTVPQGGTGLTTITDHSVMVGSGAGAVTPVGPNSATTYPLFSAGSSADPAFRAITADDMPSETGLYRAFKALTANEVKALHATPVEVIAQPSAGTYIEVVSVHAFLDFNSVAYDAVGATDYLQLRYTDGSGALLTQNVSPAGFGDASADAYLLLNPAASYAPLRAAVMAYIAGGEWYAAAGNSPVNLVVLYRKRTLAPSS
jgi:hypothetical protein